MTKLEFLNKINDILVGLNTLESDLLGSLYDELMRNTGWHSASELPPVDEEKGYNDEVIVIYEQELPSVAGGTFLAERVGYGHIVNPKIAKSYNGWNFPNVKWWCYPPKEE